MKAAPVGKSCCFPTYEVSKNARILQITLLVCALIALGVSICAFARVGACVQLGNGGGGALLTAAVLFLVLLAKCQYNRASSSPGAASSSSIAVASAASASSSAALAGSDASLPKNDLSRRYAEYGSQVAQEVVDQIPAGVWSIAKYYIAVSSPGSEIQESTVIPANVILDALLTKTQLSKQQIQRHMIQNELYSANNQPPGLLEVECVLMIVLSDKRNHIVHSIHKIEAVVDDKSSHVTGYKEEKPTINVYKNIGQGDIDKTLATINEDLAIIDSVS